MFKCVACGESLDFEITKQSLSIEVTKINKNRTISKRSSSYIDEFADVGEYFYSLCCKNCLAEYKLIEGHDADSIDDFVWYMEELFGCYKGTIVTDKQYKEFGEERRKLYSFKPI